MKLQRLRVLLATLVLGLITTSTFAVCDFGVDTCLPGFVWREALGPTDHVCVPGSTRTQAANDNQQTPQRKVPGSDTCIPGFVWREASPSDHVCVTGANRTQTAADNASAGTRRDPQCANPAQTDASPPSFVPNATTIAFIRVPDNLQVGSEPIPATGLNKTAVARDRRFVITTAVGDPESGITSLHLEGDIGWNCTSRLNNIGVNRQGTLASMTDEQKNNTSAPGSPPVRTGHFSVDAFDGNALRLVCPCMDDSGPLRVSFTIVATNGKGLETRSAPISVTYAPQAPTCGAASGEVCGNKNEGQTKVCLGGQTCDVKRSTVCSGWWIFRTCDKIQTTDMFCQ